MGAVRTTFAMVAMSLVRRRQLILRGMEDPYVHKLPSLSRNTSTPSGVGVSLPHIMSPKYTNELCVIVALDPGSCNFYKGSVDLLNICPQPSGSKIVMALEQASAQQDLNKSLLRIAYTMQQSKASQDVDRNNRQTTH